MDSMVNAIVAEVNNAREYAETQVLAARALIKSAKRNPTEASKAKAVGYIRSAELAVEDYRRARQLAEGMIAAQQRAGLVD